MLTNDIKQSIQKAYSQFLESRELKPRYGQKLMIAEVARTLGGIELDDDNARESGGHVCVVEAGTGTGKTVAYLLAAIPIAKALGKKLVISTATVALQEQIVVKDLPEIKQHSGLSFTYNLAKGRGRYLCLSKLDRLMQEQDLVADPTRALYEDEMPNVDEQALKLYNSMVEALAANEWDGDKDNWKDELYDRDWSRVTTDHRQCTGRRCSNVTNCSFLKARDTLGSVDVIVTNHDLVLADLALGGGAILPAPSDAIYVFDEGHHLPDKAINHFACHGRVISTTRWLDQCIKSIGQMLGQISGAGRIDRFAEQLPGELGATKRNMELLWPQLQGLAGDLAESEEHSPKYRFENGVVPDNLRVLAGELAQGFQKLNDLFRKMVGELEDAMEDCHCDVPKVDMENWYPVLGNWQARAEASIDLWSSYANADDASHIPKARWLTLFDTGAYVDIEVCSSPILAAHTLRHHLWNECCGAVVTSATLAALGRFDRYKMRSGVPDETLFQVVPSPFDFSRATLEIPKDAPDAGSALEHTRGLINEVPKLLSNEGGTLVLFSSRRQMMEVYEGLPRSWQLKILLQGDRSKQETIRLHKERIEDGKSNVLFGLASFAEGLDLPGKYCVHVIIAKVPFAVPDDPVDAALAEWIESRGGNSFMEITVPDAAIKMVQACGRLLRKESDEGKITIMDKRLLTRRYGKVILNSLPPFKQLLGK
ncbi:ATP-dependent DNA helicase DinG [Marinibactrum halimedae]|uniref:ATP-dependent DNA helicase DinG n=1 Tax=Marinibactrum halimedae TaxID=1444977 RepID=A0AA37WQ43_9GAMM|nr:ATP-dependent DNA helicase DinG [Marinibactrum halimedae]MCD9457995.1 ATP-dependent DNA helicase DinG [Marinibactrum halimedae]GLS27621.1 ATP-dependent DNA helicase DinG [Marinibactrum halimedae]